MRAHHALGDRDGALRAYERWRQALAGELGVGPAYETAVLHRAILLDEAPDAAGPAGIASPSTCPHRSGRAARRSRLPAP
jgi:DNA-binding SARP family transcriptional activator